MRKQPEDEFVDDPDLRRELEALFDVRPSPNLAARVRAEIAREPLPAPRWWQPWRTMVWGVGLVAACLALIVMNWRIAPLLRSSRPEAPVASSPSASPSSAAASSAPGSAASRQAETSVARAASGGAAEAIDKSATALPPGVTRATRAPLPRPRQAPAAGRELEVLVAADEARAVRALVAGGREGVVQMAAIDRPPVEDLAAPAWSMRPMEPIVLTPVQFDPVPRVGGEEGVQQ